jgi:hypothetical protein
MSSSTHHSIMSKTEKEYWRKKDKLLLRKFM